MLADDCVQANQGVKNIERGNTMKEGSLRTGESAESASCVDESDLNTSPPSATHDPDSKLAPVKMRLLVALVSDPEVQAACTVAGVSRMTAYRWLKQPAFQDELKRRRDAVLSEALERIKTEATRAAAELARLLSVDDPRLRRMVCNDILDRAMKVRELEDFENRLVAQEKSMAKNQKKGSK